MVLKAQFIGSLIITLATFGAALALMYGVKKLGVLRVSKDGELEGLDIHEHGIPPYPEFVLTPSAIPSGPSHFESHGYAAEPVAVLKTSREV